ncbi:MAG: 1,4-alpha-glucan branching protein GlgB [Epulopiscium sp.]|nr:1,4-alpha-glucan branching protein GlgB [Candidatus Epulonipiscium sp.]
MITTANLNELFQIVNVEHKEPHHILGMHLVEKKGKQMISVRAFVPGASEMIVIDEQCDTLCYKMQKIHEDGFFEVNIEERDVFFRYLLKITDGEGNCWTTYDGYSFLPVISEYDRYLFNAGNHYSIYKKLGANFATIDGVQGVVFGVWAPSAKAVSVIGDFNNWNAGRNPMRLLGDSGIWEVFIPGLQPYDRYKFQIKDQNNNVVDKADPYGRFAQMRPETASLLFDSSGFQWQDEAWMEFRKKNDMYRQPMNIYEVHLGSWMRDIEGQNEPFTYETAAEKLVQYVVEMGYTHIEFLPLSEHPFDGSWGYQVTGYYAPTSRYGTPTQLKLLIDTCHRNHIGVILDWVPAHFPKDECGLRQFDGTALYEHENPMKGEHPQWGTLIFNYGRKEVSNFLIANAIYWLEEFHIDGLRVDAVASMLYLDYGKNDGEWIPNCHGGRENLEAVEFLKHMNSVISKQFDGVMMMAEESTSWEGVSRSTEEGGLGFQLKWNMGWMNDFLFYLKKDPIYRKYHHNYLTFSMSYAFSEKFILVLSHDEVVHGKSSMIGKMPGDMWQKFANLRVAYGFMYGHPGKKLLFMGNEFGQFSEWSEARSLDWHLLQYDSHRQLQEYMKDLNHFYKTEAALWDLDFDPRGFEWIECDDKDSSIVIFVRRDESTNRELVFVCNFTPVTYFDYRIGVPVSGRYEEVFNSDQEKYGGSGVINRKPIQSQRIPWNRCQSSIAIQVPPLGMTVFCRTAQLGNSMDLR